MTAARGVAWALVACAGVACGGKTTTGPTGPKNDGAPAAEMDPACPAGVLPTELADGKFHCRQLPMVVDFPAGTKLIREDLGTLAMFRADRERGILAVIVEPRVVPIDATAMDTLLESAVSGLAPDSTRSPTEVPPLRGATVARGLTFTTPDGGSGVIRGYYAYNWLVAILAGGRRVEDPARPDKPIGKAFLDSMQLRPLAAGHVGLDLVEGARIEIPATAWDAGSVPGDEAARAAKWYVVADRGAALGVRALEAHDLCTRLRLTTPTELGQLIDSTFLGEGLTSSKAEHTERGAYFEAFDGEKALISTVVCVEPLIVQVIAVGSAPGENLRALITELAPTVIAPTAAPAPAK
jgi:hypothetical protein